MILTANPRTKNHLAARQQDYTLAEIDVTFWRQEMKEADDPAATDYAYERWKAARLRFGLAVERKWEVEMGRVG